MGRVSRDARLLFIQLWTICDDSGRTRAASRMLASLLYPYDDDAPGRIDDWLDELEREKCIHRYTADGSSYLVVCNWLKQQKIDKPTPSKLPAPPEDSREIASPREDSRSLLGREGKGEDGRGRDTDPACAREDETGDVATLHVEPRAREWTPVPLEVIAGGIPEGLELFVAAYPPSDHTSAKATAEQFTRLVGLRRVTADELHQRAIDFARYVDAKAWGSDMVPGAQNWLREEGWRKDYPLPRTKAQRKAAETLNAIDEFVAGGRA
jgi:hypothetical protein